MNNGNVRKELKFVTTRDEMNQLLLEIDNYIEESEFTKQVIHNIYYDNDNDMVIIKSKDSKVFKEKLRIRAYETNNVFNKKCSIEIKQKYKGVTYKRRCTTTMDVINDMLSNNQVLPDLERNQIYKEMEHFIEKFNCYPKLYLSYFREAFVCKEGIDLRITFDSNIKYRYTDLQMNSHDNDIKYEDDDFVVMEVKVNGCLPLWLVDALDKNQLFSQSNSKYANIIKDYLIKRR